jgi:ketosteroid isomerase-like protein
MVFAEDGEVIPATQGGFVSGRSAVEAYQAKRLEGRRYLDVVITTVHLGVSGDLAWETGTSRVTVQQGQGAPVTVPGRYLAVWRREPDGRWRIRVDLPVADPPP